MTDTKKQVHPLMIIILIVSPLVSASALVYDALVAGSELTQWIGIGGTILSFLLIAGSSDNLADHSSNLIRIMIGISAIILGLVIIVLTVWLVISALNTPGRKNLLIPTLICVAGLGLIGIGAMVITKSKT